MAGFVIVARRVELRALKGVNSGSAAVKLNCGYSGRILTDTLERERTEG